MKNYRTPYSFFLVLFVLIHGCAIDPRENVPAASCAIPCDGLTGPGFGSANDFNRDTENWAMFLEAVTPELPANYKGMYISRDELLHILSQQQDGGYIADGIFIYYGMETDVKEIITKDGRIDPLIIRKMKPYITTVKPGSIIKNEGFIQQGCPGTICPQIPTT